MATSRPVWPVAKRSTWLRVRPAHASVLPAHPVLRYPYDEVLRTVLAAALAAVEPGEAVRRAMALRDGDLVVAGRRYPLASKRRVVVVGAGKASAPMAAAVEDVIGDALPVVGSV